MADEFTVQQLAQVADLTDARIRQLLISGKLRGEKFGRDWVIDGKDARAWLASHPPARLGRLHRERAWRAGD